MIKNIVTCLLLVLTFSCKNNEAEVNDNDTTQPATALQYRDFVGSYNDTIPCADCAGILTTIDLKPDSTYVMESIYLKSPKQNVVNYTLGNWQIHDSVITLTNGNSQTNFKVVSKAEIAMLDANGNEIKNTKPDYTLLKATTPFKPSQNLPVTGLFDADKDTMHFYMCATQKLYPAAIGNNEHQMRNQYDKMKTKNYDTLFAAVEGHFELRPTAGSTATKDFFVIDKFKKFTKGAACSTGQQ